MNAHSRMLLFPPMWVSSKSFAILKPIALFFINLYHFSRKGAASWCFCLKSLKWEKIWKIIHKGRAAGFLNVLVKRIWTEGTTTYLRSLFKWTGVRKPRTLGWNNFFRTNFQSNFLIYEKFDLAPRIRRPFKTLAFFSRFLTPNPLPLANYWPLPPKKCRRLKWMVPYQIS